MFSTHGHLVHASDSPSGIVRYLILQVEETFSFEEGQFVMLEASVQGKKIKKPYSIATTNKEMQESKQIGFVVKKVSEDGMSDFLTQKIQAQDSIKITGPVGHYTDSKRHKKYLFVSTGSGLSPNVGLFTHLVYESGTYTDICQIFGEKTQADLVPEVIDLFTQHAKHSITNFFHLSREDKPPAGYSHGYVQSSLPKAIELLGTNTSCFICGKPEMVDEVREILEQAGVDKEDITFEKY